MRMDKLTSKFQMALADAQSLAVGRDHQFIEPLHVMLALLDQEGGSVRHLLAQADATSQQITICGFCHPSPGGPSHSRSRSRSGR